MSQLKSYEEKMQKTINVLNRNLDGIRAGRANPAVLDKITVDYYGAPTPIQQMAAVSVSEGRTLVIQPWDKSTLGLIEKAIQKSDMGINPSNDGNVIRIVFPQPTEERRKELCKDVGKIAEEAKISVRSIRRDANDDFHKQEKSGEISEDDLRSTEKKVQDLTDRYIKDVEKIAADKEKEILEI